MEDTKRLNYIRFPHSFIRDMLVDKDVGIRKMLLFGYCMAAERLDVDEYNAYRQVVYCYYQYVKAHSDDQDQISRQSDKRSFLPLHLIEEIDGLVNNDLLDLDEDYYGFSGNGNINVEREVSQLMEHGRKDPKFHNMVLEYYRLRSISDLFGFSVSDMDSTIAEYRRYCSASAKHTRWVSVKIGLLLEFLTQRKTEYQVILLAAYMGVKAIIGKSAYKRTTYPYIMANMFGCTDETELQNMLAKPDNERLKELYDKYTTRKVFGKINKDLQEKGFVREWLPMGKAGTFVSTKLSHKAFLKAVDKELGSRKANTNWMGMTARDYRNSSLTELNEIRNGASG